jgi:plasmid stabilization system protein ParE
MAKRNVVWTRTADLQFVGILAYWIKKNKSSTYSKKLLQLTSDRMKQISESPFIYKSTDFEGVRVTPLGNFSIYYKLTAEQIIVVAFWDNRQDPKKLLTILKSRK